ncbi:class II glutamine amidotransferase [Vibrio fluvialis]|uniref:class II glutamine amidotransferase n=1 Tax=Vibrio fluvialis TaxID=676 RepID=UPI00192B0765|nr:class II glutamine amidotransferase [Vibrio fluvialis]MBL4238577.1 class II glutamine amidotransferase [Vibrio fluvialis]MBL4264217.1 class II glutamine amidotransferase [Vibrio fluvialis]MBL4269249.1 class II glutamine amidotransferase [Vibrio fluvialis]MBL4273559.1 class II glutamine amidotransferase [Vibrio fluvialis]MBO1439072.1 class II glutamine amidotransferase [Vibrio fluvialis]
MCRWLAYQGNPIYLDQLVYQPEHSLVHQSIEARKAVTRVNADGFGLGWYTERSTPGQFHEVLPAWSDENLRSLAHHIRSHRFMAHVRSSTGTQVSRRNCHPFILDKWMFLHNGQIGEYEKVKYTLERLLPESLYVQRTGTTDSELIFLLMMKNGLIDNPVDAIRTTIHEIEQVMAEKGVHTPFKASICISDGEQFWLVRYSSDQHPPTVFTKVMEGDVILASEPLDSEPGWTIVAPQTITHVHGSHCKTFTFTSAQAA